MFVRIVGFMIMNKLVKLASAALVAATFSQAAFAAFPTNNLVLGFSETSAQSDYIINLGDAVSVVGVGGTSVVDLSGNFSLSVFNSIFTGGASGVGIAVVGASPSVPYDVYATAIRAGGAGNPAVPGSSLAGKSHGTTVLATSATALGPIAFPAPGTGTNDGSKSYTKQVGPAVTASDFVGKSGINPFGTFDSSAVIYMDLWYATVPVGYTYMGYLKVDLSTGTPHLTFTPAGAPFTAPPPAPVLTITQSGITSVISFGTTNGATYNLLYNTLSGLTSPRSTWPTLGGPIIGTGGVTNFTDTNVTSGRVYSVTAH
jgi:hypothetical protein